MSEALSPSVVINIPERLLTEKIADFLTGLPKKNMRISMKK